MVAKAGYILQPGRGKGSQSFPKQEFHTHGKTYEQAAKNGTDVIEAFIEMLQEEGKPLPEPRMLPTKPLQVA